MTIGGVSATTVAVGRASQVIAVTPPGAQRSCDVEVSGSKGTVTVSGGLTYFSANALS